MPPRIYPTVAEAIETHRLLIEEFGGRPGIRDLELLESAIFRPRNGYYTGLIEEASALMESLAHNHPFVDGNKRISFAMTDTMLRANGFFLDVGASEALEFITGGLEKKELQYSQIREWITSVVKQLEDD